MWLEFAECGRVEFWGGWLRRNVALYWEISILELWIRNYHNFTHSHAHSHADRSLTHPHAHIRTHALTPPNHTQIFTPMSNGEGWQSLPSTWHQCCQTCQLTHCPHLAPPLHMRISTPLSLPSPAVYILHTPSSLTPFLPLHTHSPTSPHRIMGTTISLCERLLQAMWPGNWFTSGTTTVCAWSNRLVNSLHTHTHTHTERTKYSSTQHTHAHAHAPVPTLSHTRLFPSWCACMQAVLGMDLRLTPQREKKKRRRRREREREAEVGRCRSRPTAIWTALWKWRTHSRDSQSSRVL